VRETHEKIKVLPAPLDQRIVQAHKLQTQGPALSVLYTERYGQESVKLNMTSVSECRLLKSRC
jgi:hypothetical protein